MLAMKPDCECCGRLLPGDGADAFICSFECTWCRDCATGPLGGVCPNCGGALSPRPPRAGALLARHPAPKRLSGGRPGCGDGATS